MATSETSGPFNSDADTYSTPVFQEWRELIRSSQVKSGDPDGLAHEVKQRHMLEACKQAGVELGALDRSVIAWLANYEATTSAVIVGIISRAHAAGRAASASDTA
ncbi:hypothetical protein ETD86_12810 [Nonomuraea turkmeniaca]|uniref:Uncharacterized protein n=1 Tax=Nonomuraea turkmeniaca TaxID=103838 RepID=A0A5S4FMV1_9ACTN|nr:hypothetical protein [Nonomuraea turkmeniaca]TMR22048.1 hypothetical protein ETD86_12810 [Nonomuraea turkmeniaca]